MTFILLMDQSITTLKRWIVLPVRETLTANLSLFFLFYCFSDGSFVILYHVSWSVFCSSFMAESGFLTSFNAFVGHVETHNPQPIQ